MYISIDSYIVSCNKYVLVKTPRCLRVLYKDSCIRLGEEVSKVLRELAKSISHNRHFSRDRLCNTLYQALQDLNSALKSHPHLFVGSTNGRTPAIDTHQDKEEKGEEGVHVSVTKKALRTQLSKTATAMSSLDTPKHKEQQEKEEKEEVGVKKKVLRPQLSKIAMRSLELSQVLPFAAFASLLVEMVAKLDHVMDQVEELGRLGRFKEFNDGDDDDEEEEEVVVKCERPPMHVDHNYVSSIHQGTE